MKALQMALAQWAEVRPGQRVRLFQPNGEGYDGIVDDCSHDGAYIWLLTVESGRKLFHVSDGFQITSA